MPPPSLQPIADLPSALDCLAAILARIGDRSPALFLDFDGTLAPIVERPEDATAPAETFAIVGALATRMPVSIVSGRDVSQLRTVFPAEGLSYAGGHGFEIVDRRGRPLAAAADATALLDELARRVACVQEVPGNLVERKRHSLAVHYRRAPPESPADTEAAVRAAVAALPGLRIVPGKMVLDVQPDLPMDKGHAVAALLAADGLDPAATAPVFIGDDITDEAGFIAVRTTGIAIVVGGDMRESTAEFRLADTGEVTTFLARLEAATRRLETHA